MKKLLFLYMVLEMTSAASAIPRFEVDSADQKSIYEPSDIITSNLVEPGRFFYGSDTIRITSPPPTRPWWWRWHY